ncbi:ATP-binding protein [Bacillus sp. CGMCC 1.16607]
MGHHQAERALEIAATGGHHILLFGRPGVGRNLSSHTPPPTSEH